MTDNGTVKNADLVRLQQAQLGLALLVKDICERHGIKYFLIAGTLLGAVRHRAFIPWDDDLDIGMLRPDYERFIAVAQAEIGPGHFLQTYHTDPHMPLPYAKIRINNTLVREAGSGECKWNSGIFIDVFPFDGVPSSRIMRAAHRTALFVLSRLLIVKCGFSPLSNESSRVKKFVYRTCISPISTLVPRRMQVAGLDFLARFFSGAATRHVVAAGGSYGYVRETIFSEWISELEELDFCDHRFSCPSGWHVYLSNLYGDYMQLPPLDRRFNRHGVIEINFGKEAE
jgi:lipopolysaccharide cholinephosphotransferase